MTSFHPVSRRAALALAIAAALPAAPALAEAALDPPSLDTVVVTGTRGEQTLENALASTTVIDREAIERRQAGSLQDLLRGEAGISLSNNGGAGKNSSLYLRGTESDHTLVLIDGVRVGSATSGGVARSRNRNSVRNRPQPSAPCAAAASASARLPRLA